MSTFIEKIIERAKTDKKTIVLPEGDDMRTLEAAEKLLADDVANLIILGNVDKIKGSGFNLDGATLIDPYTYEDRASLERSLYEIRKHKGVTKEKAHELLDNVLYLGVMLVKTGVADGMVAGADHTTGDVLRPSFQILKTAPGVKLVSSFFIMCVPDCDLGVDGLFMYADCAVEVQPDAERLAHIAVNSAESFKKLIGVEPYVALISHSTWGSAHNPSANKVVEATEIAKQLNPDIMLDGELQVDAALIPEVAAMKAPDSTVAGRANVLVFPDLDAGSVGYKLTQRLAKADAYGPITQGIAAPVNDLSRGCSAHDIYGVVAITCVQAQG